MTPARDQLVRAAHRQPDDFFVKELLLAEAGIKPAVLAMFEAPAEVTDPIAHLDGPSGHGDLLRHLVTAGWTVTIVRGRSDEHGCVWYAAIAPDPRTANHLAAAVAQLEVMNDDDPMRHRLEHVIGILLGYPSSGTDAYLGLRPALTADHIAAIPSHLWRWINCVYAGDEAGIRDAIEHLRAIDDAFWAAFPELAETNVAA
jgi:hypothetical protein